MQLSAEQYVGISVFKTSFKLSTGSINVLAFALAYNGRQMMAPEGFFKIEDSFRGWGLVGATGGIVDDEVELVVHAVHDFRKLMRLGGKIVNIAQ